VTAGFNPLTVPLSALLTCPPALITYNMAKSKKKGAAGSRKIKELQDRVDGFAEDVLDIESRCMNLLPKNAY
jgi:hypothetical protein